MIGAIAGAVNRRVLTALLAAALVATALVAAPDSRAAGPKQFDIGFADILYEDPGSSDLWMQRTRDVNADVIRVNLYWNLVAPNEPANPRDPGDPAYRWGPYDLAIRNAAQYGFDVDLTVFTAPAWAEGPNRPSLEKARAGTWRPDAEALGDFARAVGKRYSGTYSDGGVLPAVKYFEAWNEPNLSAYLLPQWQGKKNVASDLYGAMLNRFYEGIKAVNPSAQVVSGGTGPYGDPPGGPNRTQPLRFYQELLCLNTKNKRAACPNGEEPKFDIIAHHPINRIGPPTAKAENKNDIVISDVGRLTKTLRKAEKLGTTATGGRHEVWANEVWWQTNPPDKREGIPLRTHARWTAQAMYLLWKQGVSNVSFLQIRDAKQGNPKEPTLQTYQTGIYTFSGKRKPTAAAVAFPFVTDGKGKRVVAWGIAPKSGRVVIQAKAGKGGYRTVGRSRAKAGKVFTKKIRLSGKAKVRAKVGGRTSPVWSHG